MSTRPTSRKDKPLKQSDEKPFLDLAAIDEKSLADAARKVTEDLKREGKLPPPAKRDPKKDEEYEKMIRELFGEPVPRKK